MAANTGLSTYRNPDGSQALIHQATITTAHGLLINRLITFMIRKMFDLVYESINQSVSVKCLI